MATDDQNDDNSLVDLSDLPSQPSAPLSDGPVGITVVESPPPRKSGRQMGNHRKLASPVLNAESVASQQSLTDVPLVIGEGSQTDKEELALLPAYLRGGVKVVGLGEILGNALAVLYVSRQGLREHELWKILARLQYEKESSSRNNFVSKEIRAANNEIIRSTAAGTTRRALHTLYTLYTLNTLYVLHALHAL